MRSLLLALLWCSTALCYGQSTQAPTDSIPGDPGLSGLSGGEFGSPTDQTPRDPGGLYVYNMQNLSFGAFANFSNGGSITVSPEGVRTATGSVVLVNSGEQSFAAIFELEAPPGAIISCYPGPDVYLTGSNGGSVLLTIDAFAPAMPFITTIPPPGRTQISIGGTLTVGSALSTVPGTYTGNFYITFNQE